MPVHVKIGQSDVPRDGVWLIDAGLFPVDSIPRPSSHLYEKDMEKWEKATEGAEIHDTQ